MNKDRRLGAEICENVCRAFRDTAPPRRVGFAIKESIDRMIAVEEKSMKAMEPYMDKPTTARNYEISVSCLSDMQAAAEAVADGDMVAAANHLGNVARTPEETK